MPLRFPSYGKLTVKANYAKQQQVFSFTRLKFSVSLLGIHSLKSGQIIITINYNDK